MEVTFVISLVHASQPSVEKLKEARLSVELDSSIFLLFRDPELFTIEIHHGGYFKKGKYVRGTAQWADNCNTDQLSVLDLYDVAESLGYNYIKVDYSYRPTTLGYVAIRGDLDVLEFVHEISASRVHDLYITEKPEPTLLENEASATVFNFQNLLQPQLVHVDVQDDANIADDADDETKEKDEEQQVDEEEDLTVDGEDDDEERLQFIDSDDEKTDEEQDKQKRAEDNK
ncbi:acidic leucine-rich nuclear phosphoprotein 32 family member B-like [Prunus persica]|uniref:acidic leucine-rich nuclear phosphoprotein 32 family member B-like n=1 Tax=Prunus persica TaxID=3760 RepID=UPI0009AB45AA|nr:acidic leucine-rich nuclear phosphoprotein 32 family member B-like [Prunus persica]